MENAEVARTLAEIADLLELTGGDAFKVRAYRRAAQVVDLHPAPLAELWRAGGVTELAGIGKGIAEKIGELVDTGACREHARLVGAGAAGRAGDAPDRGGRAVDGRVGLEEAGDRA